MLSKNSRGSTVSAANLVAPDIGVAVGPAFGCAGSAAARGKAASGDVTMGTQEALPSELLSEGSEQGALPPVSSPSQPAAEPAQPKAGPTATPMSGATTFAAETVDPREFFDSICKCGLQKRFKECTCDIAMFVKSAVLEASREEP